MTLQCSLLGILWKTKAELYLTFSTRSVGGWVTGLTSTPYLKRVYSPLRAVSTGHFVEQNTLWKMGGRLFLVPTHPYWASASLQKRKAKQSGQKEGRKQSLHFNSKAPALCKAPAKSSGLSPQYISLDNTPCNFLPLFQFLWLSLTISTWTCWAKFCPGTP